MARPRRNATCHPDRSHRGKDLCGSCYRLWLRDQPDRPQCSVTSCTRIVDAKGMCSRHYQLARAGRPLDTPERAPKGSKRRMYNGYVRMPWANGRAQWEHRVVMEQMLGRPLTELDSVHHRNGIRHDNRPENLELWYRGQPGGQRVEDIIDYVVRYHQPAVLAAILASWEQESSRQIRRGIRSKP